GFLAACLSKGSIMPNIQDRVRALSRTDRAAYETAAERFEQSWADANGEVPEIDRFLTAEEPVRTLLLVHLIKCDMEFRRRRDAASIVEEYLARFPGLGDDREAVLDLALWEYRVDRQPIEEFQRRFPNLTEPLRAAALNLDDPKPWAPP